MSTIEIEGNEYARFGDKVLRRGSADAEWRECPEEEVPGGFYEEETIIRLASEGKILRSAPPVLEEGDEMIRGTSATAVIKRNPLVEETAEALGLSPRELREGLNSDVPTFTRKRVPDPEFDRLMANFKLSPAEARARFRGDFDRKPPR